MIILRNNLFSKKEHKASLKDHDSYRGIGRSYFLGGLPGIVGTYVGKEHGLNLEKEGYTDKEIEEKAGGRGALVGAATGAVVSPIVAASLAKQLPEVSKSKLATSALLGMTALGALGSYLGAKKNISDRVEKRDRFERLMNKYK